MRGRGGIVAGVLLLLAGVGVGLEATTFDVAFLTDPIGPKALPGLVSLLFLVGGFSELRRARSERLSGLDPEAGAEGLEWPSRDTLLRMSAIGAAFLLYAAVMPMLGFFLSTAAVVTVISKAYGGPTLQSATAAATLAGVLWLLFVQLLGLPLPIGSLWIIG